MTRIGIIAGSGFAAPDDLREQHSITVRTPFGSPSSEVLLGTLAGVPVALLQRHGLGHALAPHEINVRANVAALKLVGCRQVVSFSAVGSLREDIPPGSMVLIDQFIDKTISRRSTFFGDGCVAHVPFGNPVCACVLDALFAAGQGAGMNPRRGGTYVVMEGPQFSTRAESALHRAWGASIIGMTAMPEAKLCREAELCYALVALVTDYDCWHEDVAHVSAATVSAVMKTNRGRALALLRASLPILAQRTWPCPLGCDHVLDSSIMTEIESLDESVVRRLECIAGRAFAQHRSPTLDMAALQEADR
jgi:5'-methylthioadenosine phosphorylase